MAMIFIFGFSKKYLQEKKLCHFENPWTKKIATANYSKCDFLNKTFTENNFFFSEMLAAPGPASDPDSDVELDQELVLAA